MASDRCACGMYPLDGTPDHRHGMSCSPGQSDEGVGPCSTDWCALAHGHGGLHRARPTVEALRARLAEAEQVIRAVAYRRGRCVYCGSDEGTPHRTDAPYICALARWLEGGE